ncbi:LysR family transcriptional regulator [Falsiroseomonas sp. E2-1-a20]|uniref:LysR family transcriptional regulator n=1 Tax=Falsiroseomonas sp. E2-1-a20 TaxID=3239300 RepID=UPI003F33E510
MSEADPDTPDLPSLREFEVLSAVLAHRTTAAASRALGISQPAVSRALAGLEARLGRAMFRREAGLLVPTAEAADLSAEAQRAIGKLKRLVGQAGPAEADRSLHLITTTTMAQCWLHRVLPPMLRAHPELRVQVEIAASSAVLNAVADGTAQCGLLDGFAPHASLSAAILHRGEAHVVLPRDHSLAARPALGAADLAGLPLVALPRRFALRARVDQAFRDAGLVPAIAMECATAVFAAEMVLRGVGIGILNAFPLRAFYPGLSFRPFLPGLAMEIALVVPRASPPRATVDLLSAWLKQALPDPNPKKDTLP